MTDWWLQLTLQKKKKRSPCDVPLKHIPGLCSDIPKSDCYREIGRGLAVGLALQITNCHSKLPGLVAAQCHYLAYQSKPPVGAGQTHEHRPQQYPYLEHGHYPVMTSHKNERIVKTTTNSSPSWNTATLPLIPVVNSIIRLRFPINSYYPAWVCKWIQLPSTQWTQIKSNNNSNVKFLILHERNDNQARPTAL